MSTVTEISAVISIAKNAIDMARLIRESGTSLETAERNLKLTDLISTLCDLKIQLTDVAQENKQLRDQLKLKGKVTFVPPFYRMEGDPHAFCQQCYDSESKLMHVHETSQGRWECKTCKNYYYDEDYRTAAIIRRPSNTLSWLE